MYVALFILGKTTLFKVTTTPNTVNSFKVVTARQLRIPHYLRKISETSRTRTRDLKLRFRACNSDRYTAARFKLQIRKYIFGTIDPRVDINFTCWRRQKRVKTIRGLSFIIPGLLEGALYLVIVNFFWINIRTLFCGSSKINHLSSKINYVVQNSLL